MEQIVRTELLVILPGRCSCGENTILPRGSEVWGRNFKCPSCKQRFCHKCFNHDRSETAAGNYVFCPHCGEKLYIPEEFLVSEMI